MVWNNKLMMNQWESKNSLKIYKFNIFINSSASSQLWPIKKGL